MSNFKVGNTVRRIAGQHSGMSKGDTAKISGFSGMDFYLEGYGDSTHTWSNFELVEDEKERISKFLRENKWFIRTGSPEKSKLVQEWLFEHGMKWLCNGNQFLDAGEVFLTNTTYDTGRIFPDIMHGFSVSAEAQEITIEFETVVKSVQLPVAPEAPKKTEQQLKLEELENTIIEAQRQITELKGL